mmetsp:Transcript_15854/g.22972  ORF Transcript_15854/g.22972 Transcript_15854/m.22972 type:complete len:85 (+) Transcript_15854:1472-1726(+)
MENKNYEQKVLEEREQNLQSLRKMKEDSRSTSKNKIHKPREQLDSTGKPLHSNEVLSQLHKERLARGSDPSKAKPHSSKKCLLW